MDSLFREKVIHPWNGKENPEKPAKPLPEAALPRDQLAGIQPGSGQRGSVMLWLCDDVVESWRAPGGKGCVYSDLAIRCGLSLRAVFQLTLRQAQGFLSSLAKRLLPGLPVPHYSTLCRKKGDAQRDWTYRLRPESRVLCIWLRTAPGSRSPARVPSRQIAAQSPAG